MATQSLRQLGAVFLAPTLTFFNHQLLKQSTERPLYFLAREGYWLEQSFQQFAHAQGQQRNSHYLLVSRAFLFKIGLLNPETYPYSLNFKFSGTLYELMRTRFMLSDVSINRAFSSKQQQQKVLLPADLKKVATVLEAKQPVLEPIVSPSHDAYVSYLEGLDFFKQDILNIVDLGYSGTIQTLLSIMFHKNTLGHYLIASKPGTKTLGTVTATMKGYLQEGPKMGDGYLPLDRSMFLEALLTAPVGQFQDIRHSPLPHRKFDYYYGRKVDSQHQFHLIEKVMEGALEQLREFSQQGSEFTAQEIEQLYTAFVMKKGMLPRNSWPLFTIDDDIASEGTVNGLDFFGLKI